MASTPVASPSRRDTPGLRRRRRREALSAFAFLTPSLVGMVVFLLVPIAMVAIMSLTHDNLISPATWAGLDNFTELASNSRFWNSLLVTLIYVALSIPATIVVGLLLALALNRGLPGSRALQVIYVLPWVCSPLALGVVWRWLLAPTNGAVNALLGQRVEWMSDTSLALPTVAFVSVWSSAGYVSLFFLAGLQQIPNSVYEAAHLDGAGPIRTVWSITLPLLRPTMFFVLVTNIISSFQVYDLVVGLTGGTVGYPGGTTDVITGRIYQEAFSSRNLGMAAAMALVLFLVLIVVTLIQQRYFARRTVYDMS